MSYDKFDKIKKELLEIKERINDLINICDESMDESQIDINLLRIMKERIKKGAEGATFDDVLKIFTLLKQIVENKEDLRAEILEINISAQYIFTDVNKKLWAKINNERLDYGQGETENPDFTFSCILMKELRILFGELDAHSAYMAKDITFEGNIDDAMDFHEIIEFGLKALDELSKEI
jgi:putative sterol carrier protein